MELDLCIHCRKRPINHLRSKNYCSVCLDDAKERTKRNNLKLTVEQRKEKAHKTYINNREIRIEKAKIYIKNHPEIKKKSLRNYSKSHAQDIRKRTRKYKIEHRERYNFLNRKWHKEHPERCVADVNLRRARILGAKGKYSVDEWVELCNEYGNRCIGCGRDNIKLTVDHVIPIIMGGSNSIDNIQPLCKSCNSKKATKIIDYRPYIDWT